MATYEISSIVPSTVDGAQKHEGSVPVWFVDFTITTSRGTSMPHTYEFAASNATYLKAKCQAVADHDESEEAARFEAAPEPVAVDPFAVFGA
jgi:hypothetical protein